MATSNNASLSLSVRWPSKAVASSGRIVPFPVEDFRASSARVSRTHHRSTDRRSPDRKTAERETALAHDILGRPSYGSHPYLLMQSLSLSLRPSARTLGLVILLAISFTPPMLSRGEELPVQKALRANRPLSAVSYRQNARVSAPTPRDERVAKRQQEELPAPRTNDSTPGDLFEEGQRLEPLPDQSMEEWFGEEEWLDDAYVNESGAFISERIWARADYLLWWVEGFSVPPLVTNSPAGTDRSVAGQLDQATTTTLFGNENLVDMVRPGGRIRLGLWLDDFQSQGIEASYLALASRQESFQMTSPGDPILTRPFFNVEPGFEGPDAELIAFPGLLQGAINIDAKSTFQSGEVLYRRMMFRAPDRRIDFLIGWRVNRLDDELTIRDSKTSIAAGGAIALGTTVEELDYFATENVFNGVEIGVVAERSFVDWTIELSTKVALGNTRSQYTVDGSTTITVPVPGGAPAVAVTPAGLLAQSTNIGVYKGDDFSVIPEVGLLAGYQVAPNCRVTMGYTFMFWSRVARAGDSIDTQLNLSQLDPQGLVGPAQPAFAQTTSSVWAQGLNLGLDVRF